MREIRESDWKLFRKFREEALERFCQRILTEIEEALSATSGTNHQRYGKVYKIVHNRDRELGNAFDAPRRSAAIEQIAALKARDLLTEEEFAQFSEETRERVNTFLSIWE